MTTFDQMWINILALVALLLVFLLFVARQLRKTTRDRAERRRNSTRTGERTG